MFDGPAAFPTTQWTAVVKTLNSADSECRQAAFAALCRDYWRPLYAFSRRMGYRQQEAEDLTQGFFAYCLQRPVLGSASPQMGKLRTFLLTIFQRYIDDVRDRECAQKRGGGLQIFSLDTKGADEMLSNDLAGAETPETLYDRAWARALLGRALQDLRSAEHCAGRGTLFEALQPQLRAERDEDESRSHLAAELGMSAASVRQALCRLRKRFRECLRAQIAATLQEPSEALIDDELRALQVALRP